MKSKRKYVFNDYFEIFLYILALICFIYFFVRGNKAKTLQPLLIVAVLCVMKELIKITKIDIFPALRFSILAFIFVTMFLANEFGGYTIIPHLDKIEHFFSGVILCFLGLSIYNHLNNNEIDNLNLKTMVLFSLFFSIAMAGIWEIHEFTTDKLFGLRSQNASLDDTMGDIICGTIGAVVACVPIVKNATANSVNSIFKATHKTDSL